VRNAVCCDSRLEQGGAESGPSFAGHADVDNEFEPRGLLEEYAGRLFTTQDLVHVVPRVVPVVPESFQFRSKLAADGTVATSVDRADPRVLEARQSVGLPSATRRSKPIAQDFRWTD